MKTGRRIEVWFTDESRRTFEGADSMVEARATCKSLASKGRTGITVDVTYYDSYGDIIEGKSKWYSYKKGKLKAI